MKRIFFLICLGTSLLFFTCRKDAPAVQPVNCDGLITDSAGLKDSSRVYIPNVFTPNGDGSNDLYLPFYQYIIAIDFAVYDDRNNLMFNTDQLGKGWDGKNSTGNSTRYFYRIQATTINNGRLGYCGEFYCLHCLPDHLDKSNLRFPDQIHPKYGFVFPTNDPVEKCR